MDEYIDQYGTNEMEGFSHINPRIDNLLLAISLGEPELSSPS